MDNNRQDELKKQLRTSRGWLIAAGVAILTLPILLTKTPCCIFDFSDTGQVGDTMGGIMGPFIAILAVWFTFKAFWVQFEANEAQKDINEQQRKDIAKERLENKFYELIHLHRDNVLELRHCKEEGREAVVSSCYHIAVIYTLIDKILSKKRAADTTFLERYLKVCEKYNSEVELFTVVAYNLFFYGKKYADTLKDNNEQTVYKVIIFEIEDFTRKKLKIEKHLKQFDWDVYSKVKDQIANSFISNHHLYVGAEGIPCDLLEGNHAFFGIYFRQLYQIVKFVAKSDILSENERYDYVKILRSQLSDFEQILLYYNGLSMVGKKWNMAEPPIQINDTDSWRENMKLIARFKLIKNIPASFNMFGVAPEEYYKEEIELYKNQGIAFFEWK